MFESIIGFVVRYELLGLFIASLIGSTIFVPFTTELILPIAIKSGFSIYQIILVAALGAMVGTWINYGLGFLGSGFIERKIDHNRINDAKRFMNRYGWAGLLFILAVPLPIPVDPITIVPGISRMNFIEFSIVVFIGKVIKFAIFVGIIDSLFTLL